ncbi:hydrogenase maturation protease [Thioalkalicoccus limnaeus]|uniref:Hydrogenase maturation protease n=1 Tax=Thioalkalicoccus limnaeus TaxID=120681 RepID=A0ABV4BKV0_9GAMM
MDGSPVVRVRRALVIGYGSPIRGDDALGPLLAERLRRDGVPAWVDVHARHILTPDLAPEIAAVELVIFIDAAEQGTPGEILCQPLEPRPGPAATLVHFLDPRELLAWTRALYGCAPRAYLVSTAGQQFAFSHAELSPPVAAAVEALIRNVRSLLDGYDHATIPGDRTSI